MEWVKKFIKDEDGVTALEYTVLAALIIVVIISFFGPIRAAIENVWTTIQTALEGGGE